MREILFKAKTESGIWIEGDLIHYQSGEVAIIEKQFSKYGYEATEISRITLVLPDTICQYTGLTDKNGNKIWENDIVKRYNANGDEWRISKIVWADHSLNMGWCIEDVKNLTEYSNRLFKVGFDVNDAEKCEIIGNIFDNTDLLKGE